MNRNITRAFPHPQEPYDNDNWFDRHPVISGALYGAVLVLMVWGLA